MKKISLRRKKQAGKTVKGFSTLSLKRDIMREGRVLNRHVGAMELIADKVAKEVEKWVLERGEVTKADVDRVTAARIRKYDADVAYLYRNRGKIV
ncbi:hypothetical protein IJH02_01475 [Candidatus Saccharibacteria bacterium]|nr:hypothetical protein [Candidatus Saccharibacteria bacterium]